MHNKLSSSVKNYIGFLCELSLVERLNSESSCTRVRPIRPSQVQVTTPRKNRSVKELHKKIGRNNIFTN